MLRNRQPHVAKHRREVLRQTRSSDTVGELLNSNLNVFDRLSGVWETM